MASTPTRQSSVPGAMVPMRPRVIAPGAVPCLFGCSTGAPIPDDRPDKKLRGKASKPPPASSYGQPFANNSPCWLSSLGAGPVTTPLTARPAISAPMPDPTMTSATAGSRRASPAATSLRPSLTIGANGERSAVNLIWFVGVRTNGRIALIAVWFCAEVNVRFACLLGQ